MPKGHLGTIQLDVDVDNQMVFWKFNEKLIAKSVLTNYLKGLPCVAFISLVHVNDSVTIERHESKISEKIAQNSAEIINPRQSILQKN